MLVNTKIQTHTHTRLSSGLGGDWHTASTSNASLTLRITVDRLGAELIHPQKNVCECNVCYCRVDLLITVRGY